MTLQVVSIIATIIAVGVALAGMILYLARGQNELRRDVARDMADLRGRMARLECLFEGFTGRKPADAR